MLRLCGPAGQHGVHLDGPVFAEPRTAGPTGGNVHLEPVRYRERPDAVELDPVQLRLGQGPFETARLGGFFGALPMPCRSLGTPGDRSPWRPGVPSDVDLLLLGPDDRCGAVGFGRGVDPPAPQHRFHRTLDLERIKQAADAILREEPLQAGSALQQVEDLIGQADTSMGGARPKTTVEADNALWLA